MNRYLTMFLLIFPGILFTLFTLTFCWVLFPKIIHYKVESKMVLVDGSETWKNWKEPPIPIYTSFYVYHVKNPDEVELGLQAKFKEKGPYVYRQKRVKEDIKQENGVNTVNYRVAKTFYFDKEKSGCYSEDDLVNVVNIPFVGVIHAITKKQRSDDIAGIIGNIVLQDEPLIKRDITVRELLFEGFDVTKYTNSSLKRRLPKKKFSGGRFGLYKGVNGTASKMWEVYTGVENSVDFGKIKTWDGKSELGFWRKHSACDKINGTDGSIFHPFLTKDSRLYAFSSDVCRSLPLEYTGNVEHLGIKAYRFKAAKGSFDDPRVNEENRCFCMEDDIEQCPQAGVISLESCLKAPIWLSLPHFLDADTRYLAESGLDQPERERHETFLDIEPITGLVIRAHKRLQVNLLVEQNSKVNALQKVNRNKILFPLIWADESGELDEELANKLKYSLFIPMKTVSIAKWIVLGLGIILMFCGIFVSIKKYNLFGIMNHTNKEKYSTPTPLQSIRNISRLSKVVAEENHVNTGNSSASSDSTRQVDSNI